MIEKRNILIMLCVILLIGSSRTAIPKMRIYPQNIDVTFEYDDNVTREKLPKDYQYGIVWRLRTGFGIENFIPLKGLNTNANYKLRMRDVNTTNNEDYSSHRVFLSSDTKLKTGTLISLEEAFEIWNSQSDLFNFYNNAAGIRIDQPFGKKTMVNLSYKNNQKRFQNKAPEARAWNFFYHQIGTNISHKISNAFRVDLGYGYQFSMYNRSPIDFKGGRPIVLKGARKDQQSVITLGFQAILFNNTTTLRLLNQLVRSDSNSRAFDFSGNRSRIFLLIIPTRKLSIQFTYQIVAYDLGAYQTPTMSYELSEIRTDDQSGIKFGATYDLSQQTSLQFSYEHIQNTVFLTREFYKKNTFSVGLKVKF